MASKDHCAAEFRIEDITLLGLLKVLFQKVCRNGCYLRVAITGLPRALKSLFIYICGQKLNSLQVLLDTKGFSKDYSQGINFLPKGAASAPDSNLFVRLLTINNLRNDLVSQIVPSVAISKEGSDVDRDRV